MTAADIFIETCVVDGSELLESYNADEGGVYTFFLCSAPDEHTYRSAFDGVKWSPIDQHDYEPHEAS